jgi:biopolymer transport protein ExbB/TolQ
MASLPHADILQLVERAADRRRRTVLLELRRGINSLATIVVTAPLLGFLSTIFGLLDLFGGGLEGERNTFLFFTAHHFAVISIPIAVGLGVAIPTVWLERSTREELRTMDLEMMTANRDLISALRLLPRTRHR